jgi:hypothetical protein
VTQYREEVKAVDGYTIVNCYPVRPDEEERKVRERQARRLLALCKEDKP